MQVCRVLAIEAECKTIVSKMLPNDRNWALMDRKVINTSDIIGTAWRFENWNKDVGLTFKHSWLRRDECYRTPKRFNKSYSGKKKALGD
mmetsp:Transcript_25092/g.39666  ORF Transcript_25092/g.39666 Transcript_25092/m.39666 type:complete len:89 (-) Transcript_25092:651-917(-)